MEAIASNAIDVVFEGGGIDKDHFKVVYSERQSGVINNEVQIISGYSEGFGASVDYIWFSSLV